MRGLFASIMLAFGDAAQQEVPISTTALTTLLALRGETEAANSIPTVDRAEWARALGFTCPSWLSEALGGGDA
jgi:hypothetical protein